MIVRRVWWSLLLAAGICRAWDTPPHRQITRAALESLPGPLLRPLETELKSLIDLYCLYPDRYQEMTQFGFVRKSEGPRDAAEIEPYCLRPDGEAIHGASGDWETDAASLVYLFERILTNLAGKRPREAARFAGVLAHFISDSLSPPHAVSPEQLLAMGGDKHTHGILERSVPEFSLAGRAPRMAGDHLLAAAKSVFDRIYAEAGRNRQDLPAMVAAAGSRDESALNVYRLRSGKKSAEILADALFTLLAMSQ